VTIVFLTTAAVLEVSGDFLMRVGLGGRRWGFVAGALVLAGYGLLVNQPAWGFGRTLGLYITVFFIVSQLVAFFAGGERPSLSLCGALIVIGGLIIYSGQR
jgi:small multidrug resistance family-3 protein